MMFIYSFMLNVCTYKLLFMVTIPVYTPRFTSEFYQTSREDLILTRSSCSTKYKEVIGHLIMPFHTLLIWRKQNPLTVSVFMSRRSWNFCAKMDNVVINKRRKQEQEFQVANQILVNVWKQKDVQITIATPINSRTSNQIKRSTGHRKQPPASIERASCSGNKMSFYYYLAWIAETPFMCVNVVWFPCWVPKLSDLKETCHSKQI